MRATPKFLAALRKSHTVFEFIDVLTNSGKLIRLHVTVGTVSVDRSAQYRRSVQATCFDPDGSITPQDASDALTPFGTKMYPYKGILYEDGTAEVYPLGVFHLSQSSVVETGTLGNTRVTINLTGYDQSRKISRQKFTSTYTINQGTKVTDAIQALVTNVYPDARFDMITHGMTTPYGLSYAVGEDPWQACIDLAYSIGCQVYFNADGVCVCAPPADLDALSSPAMDYIEGEGCTMTDASAIYTDDPGYNGVIVIGATPGSGSDPVMGQAWDDDPASPTYRYGPYGQVPHVVNDSNITTQADADASASSLLSAAIGFITQTDITCWTNPAFEVDDVIQVQRANIAAKGLYILDAFTVPMGQSNTGVPGGMNLQALTLRQKRKSY